jgi:hypothetical protein
MNTPQETGNGDARKVPSQRPRRNWRVWLLLILFICLANWFALRVDRIGQQARLAQEIESLGGHVTYSYQGERVIEPQGWPLVRKVLGDQYYVTILAAHIGGAKLTAAEMQRLASDFREIGLEQLYVEDVTIGDQILPPLKTLTGLKHLTISDPTLTASGLKELKEALPHTQVRRVR